MRVISLGWGVQSFGLAAMVAKGVLPAVDYAVHSDTGHERAETYALAAKWTLWLEERGVRVVTVSPDIERMTPFYQVDKPSTFLPAFTAYSADVWVEGGEYADNGVGDEVWVPDGSRILAHRAGDSAGMLRRQCTGVWKIVPIRRFVSGELKERGLSKFPGVVEQWLGITLDEVTRIKPSGVKYVVNRYPFVEMLDRPWTRGMVMRWLVENGLEVPVRSSCVFCPYHDKRTWREIQLADNGDWEAAVLVDEAIRDKRPGYTCYLVRERKPLVDVDFRTQEEHGQLSLWEQEECSGMCFL